ncbi:hypothetical protein ES708_20945 [subsurface metagenome]
MILEKLTKINDTEIEELLSKQVSKPGDRWDGGELFQILLGFQKLKNGSLTKKITLVKESNR